MNKTKKQWHFVRTKHISENRHQKQLFMIRNSSTKRWMSPNQKHQSKYGHLQRCHHKHMEEHHHHRFNNFTFWLRISKICSTLVQIFGQNSILLLPKIRPACYRSLKLTHRGWRTKKLVSFMLNVRYIFQQKRGKVRIQAQTAKNGNAHK